MRVIPPDETPLISAGASARPLRVVGIVLGRLREALVTGLVDVVTTIDHWVAEDPAAVGSWGLRDDYSEPLVLPVRRHEPLARETRRAAHLVRLLPGARHGATLVTECGERLGLLGVDVLPLGAGMPCEQCLVAGLIAGWGERPVSIGRTVSELNSQTV